MRRELDDSTYQAAIKASPFALVDFHAAWCSPCKALAPLLAKVEDVVPGLDVFTVDIEYAPDTTAANQVTGVPMLLLLKQGTVVASRMGAPTLAALVSWIEGNRH